MKIKIILTIVFLVIAFQTTQSQWLSKNTFVGTDTVGAVLDSLTRQYTDSCDYLQSELDGPFERWYSMTIAVNDTAYLSSDVAFPDNNTCMLLPDESLTLAYYSVFLFQQWFIKSYSADIVTYRFWFIGD